MPLNLILDPKCCVVVSLCRISYSCTITSVFEEVVNRRCTFRDLASRIARSRGSQELTADASFTGNQVRRIPPQNAAHQAREGPTVSYPPS